MIKPSRKTTVKKGGNISIENIIVALKKKSKICISVSELKELERYLIANITSSDVLITLSNSKILGLLDSPLVNKFEK